MTAQTAPTIAIGDVNVTLVEEMVVPTSVRFMLPEAEEPFELLERAREWLEPHFINERGHLLQSIHSFVVQAGDLTVVVDTGVGNDKLRTGGVAGFNLRDGPFLADLEAAGCPPESVDVVVCTHLHTDHVGWNTRLVDGAWTPTFPNARYLFVEREWDYWSGEAESDESTRTLMDDSLRPIADAGVMELVSPDYRISDELWLEPSHGHTPGHVCMRIASGGRDAVITGDLMHSPIQCAAPEQRSTFDRDANAAREARRAFLERYADTDTVVLGTHFHAPAAGRITRDGDLYRYDAVEAG